MYYNHANAFHFNELENKKMYKIANSPAKQYTEKRGKSTFYELQLSIKIYNKKRFECSNVYNLF